MLVEELIEKLKEYNPKAEARLVGNNYMMPYEINISYGTTEDCTKEDCDTVFIESSERNDEECI